MSKQKRIEPPIRIRLKGVSQTRVFHPGDVISGVVEVQPDTPTDFRKIEIKIGWHTEGKGDRDDGAIRTIQIPGGQLHPQQPIVEHFDVTLPDSPWSFHGHFISIVWSVEVKVDVPWARDLTDSLQFTLSPERV